jgi:NitT/TauT family transport system ATP-binding protein
MSALEIEIRRKHYAGAKPDARPVIQDLQLRVAAGQFVCLVGPSGCGKTTLLNLVAGLDRDYEGEIRHGLPDGRTPRLGYVFQNPRLLPWRTVRENVELALPPGADPAYVDHLFEVVGLTDAKHRYPERLSVGMSRRAALVRAFAVNPDLLLMDEPLVSLDPPTARRIRELIIRLWQERPHTVLFVTHDLAEAVELADRVVFLSTSPAMVLADIRIDQPREQRDAAHLADFRERLLESYPALRGLL